MLYKILRFILIVALGLGSRLDFFPAWVHLYVGDILWALMIYLIMGLVAARKSVFWLAGAALILTFAIELSQLYQASWLNVLRHTTIGGLILGFGFLWTDLVAYTIGIGIGVLLDIHPLRRQT